MTWDNGNDVDIIFRILGVSLSRNTACLATASFTLILNGIGGSKVYKRV